MHLHGINQIKAKIIRSWARAYSEELEVGQKYTSQSPTVTIAFVDGAVDLSPDGLSDFVKFIDNYPDLGVLIDVSHNYYDGYSEDEIINYLANKNVKALHPYQWKEGKRNDKIKA